MVDDRTRPQKSAAPPRALNVKKFAESRASEVVALHSIVKGRLDDDFRSQRHKRRRTTGHDNRLSRKRYRKKQKIGEVEDDIPHLLTQDAKKVPRRVRRRIELKKNPQSGYSAAGDGSKRLRTHVWHAKRFTMTKLWGFCLPLGLHGRGKGSRAILRKQKQGVLVHDASYNGVVRLDGPEDLLLSVLSSVLVPFISKNCEEVSQNMLSGQCYGSAMLHHVGCPNSRSIAPVTYMWRSRQSNSVSGEVFKTDNCNDHQRVDRNSLLRRLWLWIHPAAFKEGYGVFMSICEKLRIDGHPVSCISLEGELGKLELIGSGGSQLIQKILHPVRSVHMKSCAPQRCSVVGTDRKTELGDRFSFTNEDENSTSTIISLMVNDPRIFVGKADVSKPISALVLGAKERETKQSTLDGMEIQKMDSSSPLSAMPEKGCLPEFVDLWDIHKGITPPAEESFLCKENYCKSLKFFGIAHQNLGNMDASGGKPSTEFSQICPLILLKEKFCENFTRWSIVLPLSWVKAFWTVIVSNGAQPIGLRERLWIACDAGLPHFPNDFPDTKAYSNFMEVEEGVNDNKGKLKSAPLRPLRVPTWPCWARIQSACQIKSFLAGHAKVLPVTESSIANVNCDTSTLNGDDTYFNGCVARTSYVLSNSLVHPSENNLLLLPKPADGRQSSPMVTEDAYIVKQSKENRVCSKLDCDQKQCFLRVRLHAYKEGVFGEGAVICAPKSSDITSLRTRTGDAGGKCQVPESLLSYCLKQQTSQILELELPEEESDRESIRPPIGFVTTGFVQGSKKLAATALCEASWLAHLRDDQCKNILKQWRRKEIYVLVRNLRSTTYRLALATIVLEAQEDDLQYM